MTEKWKMPENWEWAAEGDGYVSFPARTGGGSHVLGIRLAGASANQADVLARLLRAAPKLVELARDATELPDLSWTPKPTASLRQRANDVLAILEPPEQTPAREQWSEPNEDATPQPCAWQQPVHGFCGERTELEVLQEDANALQLSLAAVKKQISESSHLAWTGLVTLVRELEDKVTQLEATKPPTP